MAIMLEQMCGSEGIVVAGDHCEFAGRDARL
jgi:hypothetical protein